MKLIARTFAVAVAIVLASCSTTVPIESQNAEQAALPAFSEKLRWIEFIADPPDRTVIGVVLLQINEASQGISSDLHTTYYANATVLESGVAALKKGSTLVAVFDRWYSIFDPEGGMPFQKGDELAISVTEVDKDWFCAIPKKRPRKPPPPTPTSINAPASQEPSRP